MPARLKYDDVKKFIQDQGESLISKEYVNTKTKVDILCKKCNEIYAIRFDSYKGGNRHKDCFEKKFTGVCDPEYQKKYQEKRKANSFKNFDRLCKFCNENYKPKKRKQMYCSPACQRNFFRSEEYKERAIQSGRKGGLISVTKQNRRSKNEIEFCNLCEEHFGKDKVLNNEPMFEDDKGSNWDADVIIPDIKLAVAWNGKWHYKKITKAHKLKQVQARDKIKEKIIRDKYGYRFYVIKDMGKFNPKFVQEEFDKFLEYLG